MPRYLDKSGTKFWEIERVGATITRRAGKVGQAGREQSRTFANAMLARWNHSHFVWRRTYSEKYRPAVAESPRPDDDFPATDEARLVHADALQASGDPFGELIVLQHGWRGARDDATKASLGRAIDDLISAHTAEWFGDLACARELFYFGWHLGRLRRVRLRPDGDPAPWLQTISQLMPGVPASNVLGELLEALFDLPIARSLEALDVGNANTADYQHTMNTIVAHAPPTLRSLALWSNGNLQGQTVLARMRFPALEDFSTDHSLSASGVTDLATADWPKLRRLAFSISAGPATVELAPLLAGTNVPQLRSLEVGIAGSPGPFCRALVSARLVGQLEQLVIRHRLDLDPAIRTALVGRAPFVRFARL